MPDDGSRFPFLIVTPRPNQPVDETTDLENRPSLIAGWKTYGARRIAEELSDQGNTVCCRAVTISGEKQRLSAIQPEIVHDEIVHAEIDLRAGIVLSLAQTCFSEISCSMPIGVRDLYTVKQ